jgi:hypothetical protein
MITTKPLPPSIVGLPVTEPTGSQESSLFMVNQVRSSISFKNALSIHPAGSTGQYTLVLAGKGEKAHGIQLGTAGRPLGAETRFALTGNTR